MKDPKEIAAAHGLKEIKGCNCNGIPTRKFSNGRIWMNYRMKQYRFRLFLVNKELTGWEPISKLDILLTQYATQNFQETNVEGQTGKTV